MPDPSKLATIREVRRQTNLFLQAEHTVILENGYKVRPANTLGLRQDGNVYIGWELIPPKATKPTWYFLAKEAAIQAVDRHKATYG